MKTLADTRRTGTPGSFLPGVLAVLVLLFALSGCGSQNTDPRKGRVDLGHSNCLAGECYSNWEVCIGPDLLVHIDNGTNNPVERTFKDYPECAGGGR